jgi:hypothetical protein
VVVLSLLLVRRVRLSVDWKLVVLPSVDWLQDLLAEGLAKLVGLSVEQQVTLVDLLVDEKRAALHLLE